MTVQFGRAKLGAEVWRGPLAYLALVCVVNALIHRGLPSPGSFVTPALLFFWVLYLSVSESKGARITPDGAVFREGRTEREVPLAQITDITIDDQKHRTGPVTIVTFQQGRWDGFSLRMPRRSSRGPGREELEQKVAEARAILAASRDDVHLSS